MKFSLPHVLKCCLITNYQNQSIPRYIEFIQAAVRGGVTMVQLRHKEKEEVKPLAFALKGFLNHCKVPLIINDFVDIAAEIGDGVHLGPTDMPIEEARKIMGPHKIIGFSIEDLSQLERSNALRGHNYYVTASAIFPSKTKSDCKTFWGLEGLEKVVQHSVHPVTAIGGINAENANEVALAGACGIAVVGAITNAADPCLATRTLIEAMDTTTLHKLRLFNR